MRRGWSCTDLSETRTCHSCHVQISGFCVHDGSGGQICTDDLMRMRHPRYSFSTPLKGCWRMASKMARYEFSPSQQLSLHQHGWGLVRNYQRWRKLFSGNHMNQSIPMRVGCWLLATSLIVIDTGTRHPLSPTRVWTVMGATHTEHRDEGLGVD